MWVIASHTHECVCVYLGTISRCTDPASCVVVLPGSNILCCYLDSFGHNSHVLLWKPKRFRRGFYLLFPSIVKAISKRCQ